MKLRTEPLAAAIVALVPLLSLGFLVLQGWLTPPHALVAATAIMIGAIAISWRWIIDVGRLRHAVVQASSGKVSSLRPQIPSLAQIHDDLTILARTISERTVLVQRLVKSDEAIVERLPDPLIVLGADRAIRRANQAARLAFGREITSVLRHPDLRAAVETTLAHGTTQVVELALRVPMERDVTVTVLNLDPPLADGGQILILLSDRSRERAVERMRADFIANASHELRTPLASLIGFITTLQGPAADDAPAQKRFLAIMQEQAERMNRLIDDLLSLSRIEVSEHQTPSDRVALDELLLSLVEAFGPRVAARRQKLAVQIDDDLPPIPADEDQLAQLFQNLIDNAVKYGRDGGLIQVQAAILHGTDPRYPGEAGIMVSVADDGPGIPREHIPRLTERFYRVDKGRSRSVGGTGLGLAIVKHIISRHRGRLWIDSDAGKGAKFSVWLPVS